LAVVDLTTCLVIVPFTIAMELLEFHVASDLVCKLYLFLITSNVPFSALVMAAIAVDRYLCICRPFCRLLNVARARWIVCVLALSVGCLGLGGSLTHGIYQYERLPTKEVAEVNSTEYGQEWAESTILTVTETGDDRPMNSYNESLLTSAEEWTLVNTEICQPNEILISKRAGLAFRNCYNGVFFSCLLVVSVLYALIYQSVRQRRMWREKHKSSAIAQAQPLQQQQQKEKKQQSSSVIAHLETQPIVEVPLVGKDVRRPVTRTKESKNGLLMSNSRLGPQSYDDRAAEHTNSSDDMCVGHVNTRSCIDMMTTANENTDIRQQINDSGRGSILPFSHGEPTRATTGGDDEKASVKTLITNDQSGPCLVVDVADTSGRLAGVNCQNGSGSECILISELRLAMPPSAVTTSITESWNTPEATKALAAVSPEPGGNISSCTSPERAVSNKAATATEGASAPSSTKTLTTKITVVAATSLAASQKNRIANVKTAAMLFVVTLVFVITFMPALSMTMQIIPHNTTVFYMYFAYNVANPIIYSFMNQNFRKQLKLIFGKRQH